MDSYTERIKTICETTYNLFRDIYSTTKKQLSKKQNSSKLEKDVQAITITPEEKARGVFEDEIINGGYTH
jgi:hypothetical protein